MFCISSSSTSPSTQHTPHTQHHSFIQILTMLFVRHLTAALALALSKSVSAAPLDTAVAEQAAQMTLKNYCPERLSQYTVKSGGILAGPSGYIAPGASVEINSNDPGAASKVSWPGKQGIVIVGWNPASMGGGM
jgi:hypothetical protein